jgi:hypothetical protein
VKPPEPKVGFGDYSQARTAALARAPSKFQLPGKEGYTREKIKELLWSTLKASETKLTRRIKASGMPQGAQS